MNSLQIKMAICSRKYVVMTLAITMIVSNTACGTGKQPKGRILLFPGNHGSHVNFFCVLGKSLTDFGYETYILATVEYANIVKGHGLNLLYSANVKEKSFDLVEHLMNRSNDASFLGLLTQFSTIFSNLEKWVIPPARQLYSDTAFIKRVEKLKFDLAIIDSTEFYRTNYILTHKLNLRYISLAVKADPWSFQVPSIPSVENHPLFSILTRDSTLFDRLKTLFGSTLAQLIMPHLVPATKSLVAELVPEIEPVSPHELYLKSEMVLVNMDTVCLERPRIQSSNFIYIGGIGAKAAKPLPAEYLRFIVQFPDGIILMTFGSAVKILPKEKMTKFLEAFHQIKLGVIMRYDGDTTDLAVPSNVMLSKWLPQNDILGHPKTRLFINHAGANGQAEAVYHGVPMLSMPLFGDQSYNALRSEKRGYSMTLNYQDFTASELLSALKEMLNNRSYSENIKKCSEIIKSLPKPQEKAVFWIDHVIRFGSEHLRPYHPDMPLWKFFMLDIMILLIVVSLIIMYSLKLLCKCCCKMCCRKGKTVNVSTRKKMS